MSNPLRNKRRAEKRKIKKQENLIIAKQKADDGWKKHSEYHWSKSVLGLQLNYWPSTCKVQYRGQVYKNVNDVDALIEALIEKGLWA